MNTKEATQEAPKETFACFTSRVLSTKGLTVRHTKCDQLIIDEINCRSCMSNSIILVMSDMI